VDKEMKERENQENIFRRRNLERKKFRSSSNFNSNSNLNLDLELNLRRRRGAEVASVKI
jgi:hypothetical protein